MANWIIEESPPPLARPVDLEVLLGRMRKAAGLSYSIPVTCHELTALLAEIDRLRAAHDHLSYYASITDGA